MMKRKLIVLSLLVISGKYMNASQRSTSAELRKTASKEALRSPVSPRQYNGKQPISLSSSTDRLEKATIRDYGNPNGSGAKLREGGELTFHNVFYEV